MKTAPTPDIVLSNLEWVRALSMRLVGDAASADDLVQEAWLAARTAEGPGPASGEPRPWLAGMLRNLARRDHRQTAGRRAREQRAARPEASVVGQGSGDEPGELLGRSEQLMRVGGHVLQLSEPARSAMLMRWFEGLSIHAIAAKEDITESAVRSRLLRGRTELKARLDKEHGGSSREWALALIPFAKPTLSGKVAAPAASLKAGLLLACAALLCTGGVWWGASQLTGDSSLPVLVSADALPEPTADLVAPGADPVAPLTGSAPNRVARPAEREAQGFTPGAPAHAAAQTAPDLLQRLVGTVAMPDGTPVAEVGVYAALLDPVAGTAPERQYAKTDEEGRFEFLEIPEGQYRMSVVRNHDLPIRGNDLLPTRKAPHQVVVNACLLKVRAERPSQSAVPLASVTLNGLPSSDEDSGGSFGRRYPEGPTEVEFVFPVGFAQVVAAEGADGEQYFGFLPSDRAKGTVELILLREAPEFGHVTVTVAHPDLPDGAMLDLSSLIQGGEHISRITKPVSAVGGRATFELGGLLPGQYTVQFSLKGARPVAVATRTYEVRVDAGVRQTIELDATLGGMIEIAATGAPPPQERSLADVYFRRAGEAEWSELTLETHDAVGGGIMRMNRTILAGSPGLSYPLPEGVYELRLTAEGFKTIDSTASVLNGATERVELELIANE